MKALVVCLMVFFAGCAHVRTVRVVSKDGEPVVGAMVVGEDRTMLSMRKQKSEIVETDRSGYATLKLAQFAELTAGKEDFPPTVRMHSTKYDGDALIVLVLQDSSASPRKVRALPSPGHEKIGARMLWDRWLRYTQWLAEGKTANQSPEPTPGLRPVVAHL